MKKNYLVCLVLIMTLFPLPVTAAKHSNKTNYLLNQKIDKIIADFGGNLNIGVLVQDVNTGVTLYRKNTDRYFMPASNEKLFTAFAALNYLDERFVYQTRLFADTAKIQSGTLKDHAYLQFSGDPTLTIAQLDHLINTLSQKGIHHIEGNFIIDDTAFDQVFYSPGSCWDDQIFGFGSPLSALIVNHNSVKATILPAKKPEQPAKITLPDQPQFMYFINHVTTVSSTATESKIDVTPINETTYLVNGCIKTAEPAQEIIMAIHNPRANIQAILIYLLKKNHIAYTQPIKFQSINPSVKLLASESSLPLPLLIQQMLKESDNAIANALFKTMGSTYAHQPGSWQNGSDAVHDILRHTAHLKMPKPTLVDGAGSSRYNYVTPEHIVMLLHQAFFSPYAKLFISALPISGIDGTLKNRDNTAAVRGKIHAKTGTMSAVTALSGYLETQTKHQLVFSILINGFIDSPLKYQALEDQICTTLIKG